MPHDRKVKVCDSFPIYRLNTEKRKNKRQKMQTIIADFVMHKNFITKLFQFTIILSREGERNGGWRSDRPVSSSVCSGGVERKI